MKTKRTMAQSAKGLFVLFVAIGIAAAFAVPAMADDGSASVLGLSGNLQKHKNGEARLVDGGEDSGAIVAQLADILRAVEDGGTDGLIVSGDESPSFPDGGADEAYFPPDEESPTFHDGGADEAYFPPDEEPAAPGAGDEDTATPSGEDTDTPPSQEDTDTPPSQEETDTPSSDDGDDSTLPFTGGNATPYMIAGLLIVLAGAAVVVWKRRVFNR